MDVLIRVHSRVFNPVYLPYLEDESRYEVFYGGSGSGKSFFIGQKLIYQHMKRAGKNTLVVRQVSRTNRLSTFPLLRQVIKRWKLDECFTINRSDMRISCRLNGNEIVFAGLDDVEKLKSITFARGELTDIWIEEASEVPQADVNQLDLRLRGQTETPKQIIMSFNPVSITHWLKDFVDSIATGRRPGVVLKTTYRDNQFIDDDYKRVLEAFRDTDPYYYSVYCLGEWGVVGKTIFPAQIVTERILALRNQRPVKRGLFVFDYQGDRIIDSSIRWVDDDSGYITIYEDVQPGYPYAVGGDTAGDGSDFFAGQVLNNVTGKQAAVLHHRFDEDLYSRQMYCLGKYYNEALLGIETNFSTFPVKELARLKYPHQYIRERSPDAYTGRLAEKYGFRTDKITRPLIIANLVKIVREHPELINDIPTLEEMLTFVRNEKGKAEAQEGKRDDLVISLAIAYQIREQQCMEEPRRTRAAWRLPPALQTDDEGGDYHEW